MLSRFSYSPERKKKFQVQNNAEEWDFFPFPPFSLLPYLIKNLNYLKTYLETSLKMFRCKMEHGRPVKADEKMIAALSLISSRHSSTFMMEMNRD